MLNQLRRTNLGRVLIGLIILVIVVLGVMATTEYIRERPASGKYQAVFLTNGQVYFGKLSGLDGSYVTLSDAYQVQSQSNGTNASPSPQGGQQPKSQFTLSRIDQNTLIKPEQKMIIAKTSLAFWENMQNDAEVVKKINELKKK
jgi:hypothetical protein